MVGRGEGGDMLAHSVQDWKTEVHLVWVKLDLLPGLRKLIYIQYSRMDSDFMDSDTVETIS